MLQNFGSLHQTRLFPHCLLNSPAKAVGVCCSCRKPFLAKSCNGWLVFPYGIGNWPCLMGVLECALLYWLYQFATLRDLKPMEKTREVVATMNISMKTSAPPFLVMNLASSKVHDTIVSSCALLSACAFSGCAVISQLNLWNANVHSYRICTVRSQGALLGLNHISYLTRNCSHHVCELVP